MDLKKPGGFSSSSEGGEGSGKDFTDPLKEELKSFWDVQKSEIENATDADIRGKHQFPLARIKKIMLEDKDVKMISSESLPLLSKACEFFIYELTHRSWLKTEQQGRRTLRQEDILEVIEQDPNNNLDFLLDEPCPEDKELHMGNSAAQLQPANYGPDPRTSIQMNHQRHLPPPPPPPPAACPPPPPGFHNHPVLPQYPAQPPQGPHPRQPPPHLRYAHPMLPRGPLGTTLAAPPPPPRPFPRPPPSC